MALSVAFVEGEQSRRPKEAAYLGKPVNTALAPYMIIAKRALRTSPPTAPIRPDVTDDLP
jgi:hypothetical protein